MTLQLWTPDDYPMLQAWWQAHGWPPVPQAILPKLGVIVSVKESPTVAGWLYMDNSVGVSMLEWIVSNPAARSVAVAAGIKHLIAYLSSEAKRLDYGITLTTSKVASLGKLLTRCGFQETDREMIHFIRSN